MCSTEVLGRADALGVHSRQRTKRGRIRADQSSWFSSGGLTAIFPAVADAWPASDIRDDSKPYFTYLFEIPIKKGSCSTDRDSSKDITNAYNRYNGSFKLPQSCSNTSLNLHNHQIYPLPDHPPRFFASPSLSFLKIAWPKAWLLYVFARLKIFGFWVQWVLTSYVIYISPPGRQSSVTSRVVIWIT